MRTVRGTSESCGLFALRRCRSRHALGKRALPSYCDVRAECGTPDQGADVADHVLELTAQARLPPFSGNP